MTRRARRRRGAAGRAIVTAARGRRVAFADADRVRRWPRAAGRHSPARDLLQLRPLRARPSSAPADAARVATDDR
ncbi:hypothetical protein BHT10_23420 [Burkholderia pseudomallei]|nr:hypothetical protein BHT10_23420 [Burkholderia pseudomallei]